MHKYEATIAWNRNGQSFTDQKYSRAHEWRFDGGACVAASASPLAVPLPMSVAANVDPEEALVAAASSCHMLVFLHIAARRGFVVDSYVDQASGILEKSPAGKLAMTRISLRPRIEFSGERQPSLAELDTMHHEAHEECYIANSLKSEIVVEAA